MTTYLDYAATTPVDTDVADAVYRTMITDFGNSGSRTHEFGVEAKRLVEKARQQVASVVGALKTEVVFTSGATESDNIAILGLVEEGERIGKRHVISSSIEHKAVLEPLEQLTKRGFEVTLLEPDEAGAITPDSLAAALREDTLLVSLMHVNNETGVEQDVAGYCEVLSSHPAYLHVDAAQSFGKIIEPLENTRVDMISLSGHKLFAPKGIGALVVRKRGFKRVPLSALSFGGGQEKGLRPGTLAVPLIVGLGLAAEKAFDESQIRMEHCRQLEQEARNALNAIGAKFIGTGQVPYILNFAVPGVNSEAAMVALKDLVAVSNGSACTSSSYTPSHVLNAMKLDADLVAGALRFSWSHSTGSIPWAEICERLVALKH